MNERIKELYAKAHEQKPIIVMDPETCEPTHKLGHGGVPMYHKVFDPEKFAELIVRECMSQIESKKENCGPSLLDGLDFAVETIQEHFGVGR